MKMDNYEVRTVLFKKIKIKQERPKHVRNLNLFLLSRQTTRLQSLPPFAAEKTSHFFPSGAPGPNPLLQTPPLHLEGIPVTDPNGFGDISHGGVLPAGFKGNEAPRSFCSPCPVSANGVLVRVGIVAFQVQGVEGEAVNHSATWMGTWGRKGTAVLLGR